MPIDTKHEFPIEFESEIRNRLDVVEMKMLEIHEKLKNHADGLSMEQAMYFIRCATQVLEVQATATVYAIDKLVKLKNSDMPLGAILHNFFSKKG